MRHLQSVFFMIFFCSIFAMGCQSPFLNSREKISSTQEDKPEGDVLSRAVKTVTFTNPDQEFAEKKFEEGKALFQQEKFSTAAASFKTAAERSQTISLEEDSLFYQGESHFFADEYPKAYKAYNNLLTKHENTKHLDTVIKRLFLIARFWEDVASGRVSLSPNFFRETEPLFDPHGEALRIYQIIRLKDPTGPLADDSLMATATSHYSNERYRDADAYYEQLRKEYPRSQHQPVAHALSVESKLKSYQGPFYDGEDLKKAQKIIRSSLVQCPTELKEERGQLLQSQELLRQELAQRDLAMAEYYLRREKFRAARYYYHLVIKEHPETEAAVKAREALGKVDTSVETPEPLQWIAKPFEYVSKKKRL